MKRLISVMYDEHHPFAGWGLWDAFQVGNQSNYDSLSKDDTIIIHGGEDISPSIYNHKVNKRTGAGDKPSRRDIIESLWIERAKEVGASVLGICRGAQLLCAMAGGSLYQHVDNHAGPDHPIITADCEVIITNSCHHQMMNPFATEHKLLAWSKNLLSEDHWLENQNVKVDVEPEIVLFPELKGLAVQGHPEWMAGDSELSQYLYKVFKESLYVSV